MLSSRGAAADRQDCYMILHYFVDCTPALSGSAVRAAAKCPGTLGRTMRGFRRDASISGMAVGQEQVAV